MSIFTFVHCLIVEKVELELDISFLSVLPLAYPLHRHHGHGQEGLAGGGSAGGVGDEDLRLGRRRAQRHRSGRLHPLLRSRGRWRGDGRAQPRHGASSLGRGALHNRRRRRWGPSLWLVDELEGQEAAGKY